MIIKKRKLQIKEVEMNGKLPEIRLNVPLENTIGEISDNISLVFNEIPGIFLSLLAFQCSIPSLSRKVSSLHWIGPKGKEKSSMNGKRFFTYRKYKVKQREEILDCKSV